MASRGMVFVTGGAGYVGSHCVLELLNNNYRVVVADNCCNAVLRSDGGKSAIPESLKRVEVLAGKKLTKFFNVDLLDQNSIETIFSEFTFDAVIHFAALKAVGESCSKPLDYYRNNVGGTVGLLDVMNKYDVSRFIFSSSATVYGSPEYLPIDEKHPTGRTCTNPYGKTKFMVEEILKDLCASDKKWCVVALRYFNPIGAHESGEIGEDPQGIPNNLMPYISQVAVGRRDFLSVNGNDYDTKDGTGVRDYIHVVDLAKGHVQTLGKMLKDDWSGWTVLNLGSGQGHSVFEMVRAFEIASGSPVPYKVVERRPGDIAVAYANPQLALERLGWKTELTLQDMCSSAWKWQSKYPMGYRC